MILSLKQLIDLNLATITIDSKLVVDCTTIYVINATYKSKNLPIRDKKITITLPSELHHLAPEHLYEQNIGLVIEIDTERSRNEQVTILANLPSTPAPACVTISDPVLKNKVMTATICVASRHAPLLPTEAVVVCDKGRCTIAKITVPVTDITIKDGSLFLCSELKFTFHRDIVKKAMNLLEEAMGHNEEEPVEFSVIISPLFGDDGSKSTGNWADDAENVSSGASSPVPNIPREVMASPFDGALTDVISKEEQKATEKAQRKAEQAKREDEQSQRLKQKLLEEKALKALRLKDLADIARVEQERQESEAKAKEERAKRDALVKEFEALDPVVKIATNVDLQNWLKDPDTWRTTISQLRSSTSHVGCDEQEEVEQLPQILAKTFLPKVVENLKTLAQEQGLLLQVTEQQVQKGIMYFIDVTDLLANGVLNVRVSAWSNEIVVGKLTDDGTQQWGTCANVDHKSYNALLSMFPEMDSTVQHVMQTRDLQKIQRPHQRQYGQQKVMYMLVPVPMHYPSYA